MTTEQHPEKSRSPDDAGKTVASLLASLGIAALTALLMIVADAPTWAWLGVAWVAFLIVWWMLVLLDVLDRAGMR